MQVVFPTHNLRPGPGVYRFGFSRKAGALTRKGNAMQRVNLPSKPHISAHVASQYCIILCLGYKAFMGKPSSSLINIQRRGDTAQSRRRRCSISAESVLNLAGFGALARRYIQLPALARLYHECFQIVNELLLIWLVFQITIIL